MSRWTEKRVLIVGLGVSGRSAAEFLLARHANVVGVDSNEDLINNDDAVLKLRQNGLQVASKINIDAIAGFDCVVVSPGVPRSNLYYKEALSVGVEVVGEVELICREISKKCIGITGTNGKTTVTLLITHILNNAGIKAEAIGNIGVPLNSITDSNTDVFVIELSSFQLETLKTPFLDVAVLLNITPDHLDRYESMDDYASAKISIENCLKNEAHLFVEEKCFQDYSSLFRRKNHLLYGYSSNCFLYTDFHFICCENKKIDVGMKKRCHDLENMMAVYAVCHSLGVSDDAFLRGLNTFKKPPHRIEFICNHLGIDYYDDSKGTNIDAVIRAVDSIEKTIVLIAGGVDKGFPYTPWLKAFNGKVKSICAIGQSAVKIKDQLDHAIPVHLCETLEKAVVCATKLAVPGEAILLSPGCSSFDMFKDYAHRGEEFQQILRGIEFLRFPLRESSCGSTIANG